MENLTISKLNASTVFPVVVTYKTVSVTIAESDRWSKYMVIRSNGHKMHFDSIAECKEWIKLEQAVKDEKKAKQEERAAQLAAIRVKCQSAKEPVKTCYSKKAPVINWTRTKNDINGNPRYICHFLDFAEFCGIEFEENLSLIEKYSFVVKLANRAGGSKYRGKDYGGGIVFKSYYLADTEKSIIAICTK